MANRDPVKMDECPCTFWAWSPEMGEPVEGHHSQCPVAAQIREEDVRAYTVLTWVVNAGWFFAGLAIGPLVYLLIKFVSH